jgi:DNA-binding NtrC family response regulator
MQAGGSLLIVDDDAAVRTMLARYLAAVGFTVETAADVPGALAKMTPACGCILSDVRLPGLSGIDILREIHTRAPDLPVFLMTGYPTIETIIEAKQHGAAGYFRKPVDLAEVASRLRAHLGEGKHAEPKERVPAV